MKVNIIDNVKDRLIISIQGNLLDLKDKISADILNFELSILYSNKIYDQECLEIQEIFSKLSNDIDDILTAKRKSWGLAPVMDSDIIVEINSAVKLWNYKGIATTYFE